MAGYREKAGVKRMEPGPEPEGLRPISGILVVDKPEGMLSFGVVSRVRKQLKVNKVGHCGTLDPFATGALVVCLSQATRIVDQLLAQNKTYQFTLQLGVQTDTLDKTGRITHTCGATPIPREQLMEALDRFRGRYVQQVPLYSAVHVNGRRLYDFARKGIEVELPMREVHIHELELEEYNWPEALLTVHCSKGTYVRQLAADIGNALGCGAHVTQLRRLASGPFHVDRAVSLDELADAHSNGTWREKLIPINEALSHLPAIEVQDEEVLRLLRDGHLHRGWEDRHRPDFAQHKGPVRLIEKDDLIALWWPQPEAGQGRKLRLFR